MSTSRREFLLAGSTASALWLTGCGGGGSSAGAPKPGAATPAAAGVCSAQAPAQAGVQIVFSNASGAFPSPAAPLVASTDVQIMGCTNPLVLGVESTVQELYVNIVQRLTDCQASVGATELLRSLRLHLAIPRSSSSSAPSLDTGLVFNCGDSTDPLVQAFSGSLVVNDPTSDQNWAYQITSGTVEIEDYQFVGIATLKLTNVVASAAAAGNGNNLGSGTIQLDGRVTLIFDFLSAVGG